MGKFTINQNPEFDFKVSSILETIALDVNKIMGDDVKAVILYGSYGKGEGGVYFDNNQYYLVNDLDLIIATNIGKYQFRIKYKQEMVALNKKIVESKCGLKEVDFKLANPWFMWLPGRMSVERYELMRGYQVIYGNLPERPVIFHRPLYIPIFEGSNFFRNRGSGLILPAYYFLNGMLGDYRWRKNSIIEMQKACIAMGDALLIALKKFHYSYQQRLKIFREDLSIQEVLPKDLYKKISCLYIESLEKKMNPSFEWTDKNQMMDRWFHIRDTFLELFIWFEGQRLKKQFLYVEDYVAYVLEFGAKESIDLKIRSLIWELLNQSENDNSISPIARIRMGLCLTPLLLKAINIDFSEDPSILNDIKNLLPLVGSNNIPDWSNLVRQYFEIAYSAQIADVLGSN